MLKNFNLTINSENANGFFTNQSLRNYIDGLLEEVNDAGIPGILNMDFILTDSMHAQSKNTLLSLKIPLVPYALDETTEDLKLLGDTKKIKSKNEYIKSLKSFGDNSGESYLRSNLMSASKRICDYIKGELAIKYLEAKEILNIASKGIQNRETTSDEAKAKNVVEYIKSLDVIDFELDNIKVTVPNTREYFGGHTSPKELRENIEEYLEEEILKGKFVRNTTYIVTDGENKYIFGILNIKQKAENNNKIEKVNSTNEPNSARVDYALGLKNMDYKARILPENLKLITNLQNENSFGA